MCRWVFWDPSNRRGFFEWLSPLSISLHADRPPWIPCPPTYSSASRFRPESFFLPEYPSSCLPLRQYYPHRSDNDGVFFLPPIEVWLFPILPANVFLHRAGKLLPRISDSLLLYFFHS